MSTQVECEDMLILANKELPELPPMAPVGRGRKRIRGDEDDDEDVETGRAIARARLADCPEGSILILGGGADLGSSVFLDAPSSAFLSFPREEDSVSTPGTAAAATTTADGTRTGAWRRLAEAVIQLPAGQTGNEAIDLMLEAFRANARAVASLLGGGKDSRVREVEEGDRNTEQ